MKCVSNFNVLGETAYVKDKHLKVFNVVNYDARGNGTTDDTNAISNTITACGSNGVVYLPSGTYIISSNLTINDSVLIGCGKSTRFILKNNAKLIVKGISHVGNFSIVNNEIPSSDFAIEITGTGDSCSLDNIFFENVYGGVYIHNCSGVYLSNLTFENVHYNMLQFKNANDVYVDKLLASNVGITNAYGNGIVFEDYVQAIEFVNINIIAYNNPLVIIHNGSTTVNGNSTSFCVFTNCYFDGCAEPVRLFHCFSFKFTNCWFSQRANGVLLDGNCYNCTFVNCMFQNCSDNGAIVSSYSGNEYNSFIGCDFINNTNSGVLLNGGIYTKIVNCNATYLSATAAFDTHQKHGINIASNAIKTLVTNCVAIGNSIDNILDNGSGSTLANNITA